MDEIDRVLAKHCVTDEAVDETERVYPNPAIFTTEGKKTLVSVPDLPGLHTFGNSMAGENSDCAVCQT